MSQHVLRRSGWLSVKRFFSHTAVNAHAVGWIEQKIYVMGEQDCDAPLRYGSERCRHIHGRNASNPSSLLWCIFEPQADSLPIWLTHHFPVILTGSIANLVHRFMLCWGPEADRTALCSVIGHNVVEREGESETGRNDVVIRSSTLLS